MWKQLASMTAAKGGHAERYEEHLSCKVLSHYNSQKFMFENLTKM